MFTKESASVHTIIKSFFLNRPKLSPWSFRHVFKDNYNFFNFKSALFSTDNSRTWNIKLFMIRPPILRRMIRCTQHFQHLGLTWLTQWSNLTSLWYGQFSLSLGKAPTFPLHSYTLKWGPVRAGAQLVRVNSDKQHGLQTATFEQKWWQRTQSNYWVWKSD